MLLPEMVESIKKILEIQTFLTGFEQHPFVFAVKGEGRNFIKGHTAIKMVVDKANIGNQTAFTASNLRKYISTEMIFLNIGKTEQEL